MKTYRILSLDGGGVRGVLTARLLGAIEAARPGFLQQVDLFAGTSTGAILAVALANNLTPDKIVALYKDRSKDIFHKTLLSNLEHLFHAEYQTESRYAALHDAIGDVTLRMLPKRILVSSVDLDSNNETTNTPPSQRSWKAKFYHNFAQDNKGNPNTDLDRPAVEVIMRSSAAPTYFPIYRGSVDGGVVANDPSMCALAQAVNPHTGAQQTQNVVLLSVGTGARPEFLTNQDSAWGDIQWIPHLLNLIFDTGSGLADYQCAQVLGNGYHRLNPNLPSPIGLDAVDAIEPLLRVAADTIQSDLWPPLLNWIDTQWRSGP